MKVAEDRSPVVVVTGGAGGIGEATVRLFVRSGARVVFGDLREEKGRLIEAELNGQALFRKADVRRETEIEELFDAALREFGALDCVVNNASTGGVSGPIAEIPTQGFDETIGLTLRSVFLGIKHAASRIDKTRGGTIINVASIAGLQAGYGGHAYSAAKAAIIGLTRTTAMELGERSIRVNCVCPGGVATGIFGAALGLPPDVAEEAAQAIAPYLAAGSPLPGVCRAEEIASAICWLAGPGAAFVNGHALVVDGGTIGGRPWSQSQAEGRQLMQALAQVASAAD